ncbi:DUF4168 domain-containing protein [Stakelama marina]|uniref:DUF4168 domain-containing protein n=1 Tax=Stakelama marina TaxID=2826939 RepID=A0A8T4IBD9_9SPHN|nr:DUF4168 domain-containing protein [Stakelama marina]MBR0551977.1 DUF4168 domain-containing protein [Stakelama marina]
MKTPIKSALVAAACTLGASAAIAQPAPQAQQQAMPQVQAATNVSDAEVNTFASTVVKLNKIQADSNIAKADKRKQMIATLQASGLKPQRFNGIAKAAQTNDKVRARVKAAMMAKEAGAK